MALERKYAKQLSGYVEDYNQELYQAYYKLEERFRNILHQALGQNYLLESLLEEYGVDERLISIYLSCTDVDDTLFDDIADVMVRHVRK